MRHAFSLFWRQKTFFKLTRRLGRHNISWNSWVSKSKMKRLSFCFFLRFDNYFLRCYKKTTYYGYYIWISKTHEAYIESLDNLVVFVVFSHKSTVKTLSKGRNMISRLRLTFSNNRHMKWVIT